MAGCRQIKLSNNDTHTKVPGPQAYNTTINSCVQSPGKQTSIGREIRFKHSRPDCSPDAQILDTRSAVYLLRKVTGGGTIPRAERKI